MTKPTKAPQKFRRFLKTATLSRVIIPLKDKAVLRLSATRSWEEGVSTSNPLNWASIKKSDKYHFEIRFVSLIDGQFSRTALLELLEGGGAVDALVRELHTLVPKEARIGDRFATLLETPGYRNQRYVALFEWYPTRREPPGLGRDQLQRGVRDFRIPDEVRLGFQPTILDLKGFLPLQTYREVYKDRKKRLSDDFQNAIDDFEAKTAVLRGEDVKKALWTFFPRDMVDSREYRLREGELWELIGSGRWE